jgi:acyl-CoA hydrolase
MRWPDARPNFRRTFFVDRRTIVEGAVQGKTVAESECTLHHLPMPDEVNLIGTVHGGNLLKLIDTVAGLAAYRHAGGTVTTASLERMDFLTPVSPGELIVLKSSLNMVGKSSIDVGVRVEVQNIMTGETRHAATAYLTYVHISEQGKPLPVPPLVLETEDERRRHARAVERRRMREIASSQQDATPSGHRVNRPRSFPG